MLRLVSLNLRYLRLCCMPVVAIAITACSSSDKTASTPASRGGMESRLMRADTSKNLYEKEFNTASAGNRGNMKKFDTQSYRTGEFSGQKNYKTGLFSQAGKVSHMGSQDSRYGSQDNRMSKSIFATKDSTFGNTVARQGGQTFRGGDTSYKTGEFAPAKKALDDNKRIYLDTSTGDDQSTNANAYSEDQVKRMLGR